MITVNVFFRKLLHLPGMSVPLLMNMAHCEVISSSSIDFIPEDISQSFDEKQVETAEVLKVFLLQNF